MKTLSISYPNYHHSSLPVFAQPRSSEIWRALRIRHSSIFEMWGSSQSWLLLRLADHFKRLPKYQSVPNSSLNWEKNQFPGHMFYPWKHMLKFFYQLDFPWKQRQCGSSWVCISVISASLEGCSKFCEMMYLGQRQGEWRLGKVKACKSPKFASNNFDVLWRTCRVRIAAITLCWEMLINGKGSEADSLGLIRSALICLLWRISLKFSWV